MKNVYLVLVMALLFFSCKDVQKEYYSNGMLSTEIEYNNGVQRGDVISYYPNGVVKEKYKAINMIPDGLYKNYYDNGQLQTIINYANGMQNGILKEYYINGKLKSEQHYKNNKPHGVFTFYYSNAKLKEDALMNNDTTIYYIKYDSLGNWIDEYRECNVEIPKDELYLGEEYSIKFNVAGPFKDGDKLQVSMMIYQKGVGQFPQIYFMDIKNPVLKFTPPKTGKWSVSGGIFLTRDGKLVWFYDEKYFPFNVIDKESTTMD